MLRLKLDHRDILKARVFIQFDQRYFHTCFRITSVCCSYIIDSSQPRVTVGISTVGGALVVFYFMGVTLTIGI